MYYERQVYTGLDFLGDVGGLYDALCAIARIFLFIISFLTNSSLHDYLLPMLYKRDNQSQNEASVEEKLLQIQN